MSHPKRKPAQELGDFTTTPRVLTISLMAIVIGLIGSGVAWFLLKLIGLFTNLFYYQRINTSALLAGRQPSRDIRSGGACDRLSDYRSDGPLWIGTHPRSWHSRGD
jgi:hypothetical protein